MRVPAVAAAVSLIATTVGTLPAKVFVRDENGGKEPDADHPGYALVHDDAAEWVSASQLRTQLTTDALLHGNGYAFANRVEGRVVEFNRLDPRSVSILIDDVTGEPAYRVSSGATQRTLSHRDVLHIPAFSIDGVSGLSPIYAAREAIGLALVLEQHAGRLFANGGRPSGLLKFPTKLTPDAATRMRSSWQGAHAGEQAGKTAVLEEGGEFQPLAFTSVDAQFAEMRVFQTIEIARAFRVPPHMIFELGRATWGNSEQMGSLFLQMTLLPWLRVWEDAYRRLLLSPEERKTHVVNFMVDDLLRADFATRMEGYSKAIASRILNPNEARAMENRPAYAGGGEFFNPHTTTTAPAGGTTPEALAA